MKPEREAEAGLDTTSFGESLSSFISNYRYWLLVAYFFCCTAVWWGIMTWLPSYLKVARGFSWVQMGALASLPYTMGAICLFIFGYLSDKVGRRAPFCAVQMIGMAVTLYFGAYAKDNLTGAYLIALAVAFNGKERNFTGEHFWARGYAVSTVGFELERIQRHIREQESSDDEGRF